MTRRFLNKLITTRLRGPDQLYILISTMPVTAAIIYDPPRDSNSRP